jgi:glycosyltransferase involved in cell wall biosynthesis
VTDGDGSPVRSLALVMGGDLFEDFHDTIDVSLDHFRAELTGGWLFGYVEALAAAGVRTTLIHASARVTATRRFTHEPTGAAVTILPAPRRHRFLRAAYRRSAVRKSLSSIASYGSIPVLPLVRELRRCGAEAILTQEYEHARFDALVALGALVRLPVFATFQGGDAPRSRIERAIRPWTLHRCAGLIVPSGRERGRLVATYALPTDRIADIPNAMDVTGYEPMDRGAARRALGIAPATRVVEWHGRVTLHRKGLDVLLAAWEQLCRRRPARDVLLLLVGTGADAPELHRRITATGLDSIRWRDEYLSDRAALLPYPSAADIFVLPSRHEGFPVAPIEAMAAGLPVVAADAPGVSDILADGEGSGGIVVPCEDVDALAAALLRLIDDPEHAAELGRRARRRAESHYDFEVVGAQLRAFIFRAATGGGERRGGAASR